MKVEQQVRIAELAIDAAMNVDVIKLQAMIEEIIIGVVIGEFVLIGVPMVDEEGLDVRVMVGLAISTLGSRATITVTKKRNNMVEKAMS